MPGALLGMIVFITSEIMFFGGLFAAYLSLRADAPAWPPEGVEIERALPIVLTVVLLRVLRHGPPGLGRRPAGGRAGVRTCPRSSRSASGLAFLGGQAFEYSRLGFEIDDGTLSASVFYATTGFHGLHVFIGVVILGLAGSRRAGEELDPRSGPGGGGRLLLALRGRDLGPGLHHSST